MHKCLPRHIRRFHKITQPTAPKPCPSSSTQRQQTSNRNNTSIAVLSLPYACSKTILSMKQYVNPPLSHVHGLEILHTKFGFAPGLQQSPQFSISQNEHVPRAPQSIVGLCTNNNIGPSERSEVPNARAWNFKSEYSSGEWALGGLGR